MESPAIDELYQIHRVTQTAPVLVLSVRQPWASLLAVEAKLLETRSWPTKYRGPLAIHASKAFPMQDQMLLKQKRFFEALKPFYTLNDFGVPNLPTGAILSVHNLVDCLSTNNPDNVPDKGSNEFWFGNFMADRFGWKLADARRLEIPIRCTGKLGLWVPEPNILERLEILL